MFPVALVWSWIAGHWKGALLLALVLAVWGYGRWQYSAGGAAVEARWQAQASRAKDDANRKTAAQNARLLASNGALADAQARIQALDYALGGTVDRLREYAARPRNLSPPADYPRCVAELAGERDRAGALGQLLVEGSDLARALAAERDDAVARLWAADVAWPR